MYFVGGDETDGLQMIRMKLMRVKKRRESRMIPLV